MNTWAWIGLSGIVVLTLIPFIFKENRTKTEIRKAFITIIVVIGIIIAVSIFNMNYLLALLIGLLIYILLDKKTYTKKRLFIYGGIILILGITSFIIFRDNPDYVLNHLKNNPETTSLYVAHNGDEMITYQSEEVRPLASVVKIPIAIEYAMQVEEGRLDKNQHVSLDELSRFYFDGSDGGAHGRWLNAAYDAGKVENNHVTLHEVAKGMITYSSNANTDYLMHQLGISEINSRIDSLELTQHEPVYPLVSALLISEFISTDSKDEVAQQLESMPIEHYRQLAIDFSNKMKSGELNLESYSFDIPLDIQRIWSDRLPGASASEYGKLLTFISSAELPSDVSDILRDLMEWPMEINKGNKDFYAHLGAKGGSTGFIRNDALYAEDLNGNTTEIVLLTDDLNRWQQFQLNNNLNSFEVHLVGSEEYRKKVKQELE